MTDAYALTLAGLPGIALRVRAPGYLEQAHSAEDTLDEVSPADLRQAVTELANGRAFSPRMHMPFRWDISPQPKQSPRRHRSKQKLTPEFFGLWRF